MTRTASFLSLTVALAIALGAAACHRAPSATATHTEPTPSVAIQTSTVELREVPAFLAVTGELKGGLVSAVAADAAGKVRETLVERGSQVKAGDILVKLDDRAARLTLRETEAALAQAKSRLDLAKADWQRNEQLAKSKVIAAAEMQKLEADFQGREADLAAAEARRDTARKNLEDTEVRAPFDGTVAERFVSAGEYVQPGAKVAMVIANDLRLWLNVPENAAGSVQPGQAVNFRVPAFPGQEFAGQVRYISPIIREAGRDLLVEAEVSTTSGRLLQGMFAEAHLMLPARQGLVVPASAVRQDAGVHKVLVLEGEHLSERIVDLGATHGQWTEVHTGLAAGEKVVVQPTREARDGVRFTLAAS